VIGIRRSLEVFQVATDASRVHTREIVVAIHVTLRALQRRVRPRQREAGGVVIESGARPGRGAVTLLTSLREAGLHVIGIGRSLEVFQVAAHAGRIRAGQVVVAIYVALRTLNAGMRPSQRETGGVVIKVRTHPRRGVVALRAGL